MAKINKWDALGEYVSSCRLDVMAANPTAEESGAFSAYENVLHRMNALEALEKKLDKS